MTLIEALDAARFPQPHPPIFGLLADVLEWQRTDPERVQELYRLAGMPVPVEPVSVDPAPLATPLSAIPSVLRHAPTAQRLYAVLKDGHPHLIRTVREQLQLRRNSLTGAVRTLREKGFDVVSEGVEREKWYRLVGIYQPGAFVARRPRYVDTWPSRLYALLEDGRPHSRQELSAMLGMTADKFQRTLLGLRRRAGIEVRAHREAGRMVYQLTADESAEAA